MFIGVAFGCVGTNLQAPKPPLGKDSGPDNLENYSCGFGQRIGAARVSEGQLTRQRADGRVGWWDRRAIIIFFTGPPARPLGVL